MRVCQVCNFKNTTLRAAEIELKIRLITRSVMMLDAVAGGEGTAGKPTAAAETVSATFVVSASQTDASKEM